MSFYTEFIEKMVQSFVLFCDEGELTRSESEELATDISWKLYGYVEERGIDNVS